MKKYEIINSKWIRQIDKYPDQFSKSGYIAIRINDINQISTTVPKENSISKAMIYLQGGHGCLLTFEYSHLEMEMYNEDLRFFESLLF